MDQVTKNRYWQGLETRLAALKSESESSADARLALTPTTRKCITCA